MPEATSRRYKHLDVDFRQSHDFMNHFTQVNATNTYPLDPVYGIPGSKAPSRVPLHKLYPTSGISQNHKSIMMFLSRSQGSVLHNMSVCRICFAADRQVNWRFLRPGA